MSSSLVPVLMSSLIFQLSAESDSCYSILSQLYSSNSHSIWKPSIGVLRKCMTDMLSLTLPVPGQGPIYIIFDALNECPNMLGMLSAQEQVLELTEEIVDLKLSNVHICVASQLPHRLLKQHLLA